MENTYKEGMAMPFILYEKTSQSKINRSKIYLNLFYIII
jgi:hypothetical protein